MTAHRAAFSSFGPDDDTPVFVISVAAQLAGMHAQTLRQYDRLGLVSPSRTRGGGRRYSGRDVALLREVQRLSQEEGVSLAGIRRILELEHEVDALHQRVSELLDQVAEQSERMNAARVQLGARIFAAGAGGEIVAVRPGQRPARTASQALVLWERSPITGRRGR